jgi:hypothetical protein
MIVIAGGMILLDGANISTVAKGKDLLWRTLTGVAIILFAWVITNTLIHALGRGSVGTSWSEFSCPDFLQGASQPGTSSSIGSGGYVYEQALSDPKPSQGSIQQPNAELLAAERGVCSDRAKLAAVSKASPVIKNSASLTAAIACLMQDPVVKALTTDDRGGSYQLYTYENNNPLCNFTRGLAVCGTCAHTQYSCHYGGRAGTDGAEAADFNWNGKWVFFAPGTRSVICADRNAASCASAIAGVSSIKTGGEKGLEQALILAAAKYKCAVNRPSYEPIPGAEHTHVSTTACSGK